MVVGQNRLCGCWPVSPGYVYFVFVVAGQPIPEAHLASQLGCVHFSWWLGKTGSEAHLAS